MSRCLAISCAVFLLGCEPGKLAAGLASSDAERADGLLEPDLSPGDAGREAPDAAAEVRPGPTPAGGPARAKREIIECDPASGFCVVADEPGEIVENIELRLPHASDDQWLCIYDQCGHGPGGVSYGGGILVQASDVTVRNVRVEGGAIGIAARQVSGLVVADSELQSQSAWGIYMLSVDGATVERNEIHDSVRSCTLWDGSVVPDGCESAGVMAIDVQSSHFIENVCSYSGDCYYLNGEFSLASNDNTFERNVCTSSPHNCFEITFSTGNVLSANRTGADPAHGDCRYPFWIGCSEITFAIEEPNDWRCAVSADEAYAQARSCTDRFGLPTEIMYR